MLRACINQSFAQLTKIGKVATQATLIPLFISASLHLFSMLKATEICDDTDLNSATIPRLQVESVLSRCTVISARRAILAEHALESIDQQTSIDLGFESPLF